MVAVKSREADFRNAALLAELPELDGWQPAPADVVAEIDLRAALMLSALFDRPPLGKGEALPPGWHWAFFIEPALQRDIGADGHPRKGGFLPPIALPRRMFAGSRVHFHQPLIVGRSYRRMSEVAHIAVKHGRSGKLAFVKVNHVITDARGGVCLQEEQDIVYRESDGVAKKTASGPQEVKDWTWRQEVVADPVLLFRYSAVTFNGHRIHYDHPYATQEEGYPALVVHGPLLATLMLELLRAKLPDAQLASFRFSGKSPVFAGRKFEVAADFRPADRAADLAILSEGQTAMVGLASLGPDS